MYITLSSVKFKSALVNLDNITLFSKTVEEHMSHLRYMITQLNDSGVTLKLKRFHFWAQVWIISRHVIGPRKWKIANPTTYAIKEIKDPTNQVKVR